MTQHAFDRYQIGIRSGQPANNVPYEIYLLKGHTPVARLKFQSELSAPTQDVNGWQLSLKPDQFIPTLEVLRHEAPLTLKVEGQGGWITTESEPVGEIEDIHAGKPG